MKWKLSMPPATQAPEFRDVWHQTPLTQDWIRTQEARGFDWKVNMDAYTKLEHLVNEQWRLPFIQINIMGPHQGQLWTGSLGWYDGDMVPITIWLHPFMTQNVANETLWHEIQHAYQDLEGRMNTQNYMPFLEDPNPSTYEEHPIEIDAESFAQQMSDVQLVEHAAPRVEPDWVPNELHLDRGEWNHATETYELTNSDLWDNVVAQVNMFRFNYRLWQSTWIPAYGDSEDFSMWSKKAKGIIKADYQGWSNWETWHAALMMDNEQESYNAVRKLYEKYKPAPEKGIKALENWTIQNVLGPYNAQQIEDAKEWNTIPEDERIDYNYENLKEKSQQAADFVDALGFGADVSDAEPQIIDPNLVNWEEIWNHLKSEDEGNQEYEDTMEHLKTITPYDISYWNDEQAQMEHAWLAHHGVDPNAKSYGDERANSVWGHMTWLPKDLVQQGVTEYQWPEGFGDKTVQQIEQEGGWNASTRDLAQQASHAIQWGRAVPWQIQQMQNHLAEQGYTPEEIQNIMRQRYTVIETPDGKRQTVDLEAQPKRPKPDLDQPGDFTLPENWSHAV